MDLGIGIINHTKYFLTNTLPKTHNEAIEYIEPVTHVLDKPVSGQLEQHFNGEDAAEDEVADLHHPGESLWLVVVLYAHAEGVDEDAEKDSLLEEAVVHHSVQTATDPAKKRTDSSQEGGETSG